MLPGHPAQTSCGRQAKKRREGEDMSSPEDRGEHLLSQIILQKPLVHRSRSDKKKKKIQHEYPEPKLYSQTTENDSKGIKDMTR